MGGWPKSRKGRQTVEKYCESELTPKIKNGVCEAQKAALIGEYCSPGHRLSRFNGLL
jgi:hypothetical protein